MALTFDDVVNDPDFHSLPMSERRKVLLEIDPDYAQLPSGEQMKVLGQLKPIEKTEHPISEKYTPGRKPILVDGSPVKEALKRMIPMSGITDVTKTPDAVPGALRKLGDYAGLNQAGETIGKTAAYHARPESVTPQMAQEAGLKPTAGEIVGAGLQVGSLLLPYGRIAKGAETLATTAKIPLKYAKTLGLATSGATGGYTYEAGEKIAKGEAPTPGLTTAIGAVAPPIVEGVINKFKSKPFDVMLSSTIKKGMDSGIKPSVQSKGTTAGQGKVYYEKAQKAVETIIDNKPNLEFVSDEGDIIKGVLPKSLAEFSDSIGQTKKNIFTQYDALAQSAGQHGATVELAPVAKELGSLINNKVINDLNPNVVEYAKAKVAALTNRNAYTTAEAQEAVTVLNNSLKAFYSNPSYETASKAAVDAMIANKMRQSLDDVIEKTSGAGYQELKKTYGALKAIEKDVTHRTTIDARKNIKGLVDFSDIYSGSTLVHGLLTMHPATIASAATAKGISSYIKWRNNPNKIVADMFNKSEKIIAKKATITKPPKPLPRFPGDMAVDAAKKIRKRGVAKD